MSKIEEMAKELGQALGRTEEYQALRRAAVTADEDRELTVIRNDLQRLEAELMASLRGGQEPTEEEQERYESLARKLQALPTYQRVVAAQANFDRVLQKVNDTISQGIEDGSSSRIILSS